MAKEGFWKLDMNGDDMPYEDEILPAAIYHVTPDMVEQARTELNETDEMRLQSLEELRSLIETDTKLVTPTDDKFLLIFLRARKFNVKKSFNLFQKFWNFRKEHRALFDAADMEIIKELIQKNFLGCLRFRDKSGGMVFIFKIGLWNPDEFPVDTLILAITGVLLFAIEYPATQIAGFRMIFDARGISWTHLKHATPSNLILLVRSTQFCFPGRYKGIHILSDSKIITFFSRAVYPLFTSKLKQRTIIHGVDLEPFKEFIHPSVLPEEFGGEAGSFDNSKWGDILDDAYDRIKQFNATYGYKD